MVFMQSRIDTRAAAKLPRYQRGISNQHSNNQFYKHNANVISLSGIKWITVLDGCGLTTD